MDLFDTDKDYFLPKEYMGKETKNWTLSVGFYPGLLFGLRTYDEPEQNSYVFYIPFVDVALEVYK